MASETAPRRDIQALRAVAVAMVVIFHLWPSALPGGYVGVDVFLVISGFLITRHLLQREPTSGGELADFWGRRIRRLLPAASGALVGTAVLALVLMPTTSLLSLAKSTVASAFAVENWNLILISSDYLAADDDPSPVQHFWSLGVEEQFYFVWPLIIALCLTPLLARHSRKAVGVAVLAVVAVSFALSVVLTGHGGALAYFATVTRVWELGLGAVVAVWHAHVVGRGAPWLRRLVWWGGAAAITYSAFAFADLAAFPGYIALLPVAATAAMIAVSGDGLGWVGERAYAHPSVQWVGDRSYSIYLWHWPLIVALAAVMAKNWVFVALVLAGTTVLAAASKRWLEDVPRRSPRLIGSRKATAGLLVACTALSLVAATSLWLVQEREARQGERLLAAAAQDPCLGAAAARDAACGDVVLATTPVQASQDKPDVYADDCWNSRPFTSRTVCHYGMPDAAVTVALYGNSHAGQWQPPLAAAVEERGWALDTYLASECYPADEELAFGSGALGRNCLALQTWAADSIVGGGYDVVVMASRTFQPIAGVPKAEQFDRQVESYARVIERFVSAGQHVVVIRDTPYPAHDIPQCLASKVTRACATARDDALPPDPLVEAAQATAAVTILDVSDLLCGPEVCEPVIGGLITNFDQGHFTKAFAATLEPEVSKALVAATASG
ncbi:acyltransferase family protein [Demequina sp.]|uniref:acyltransferase family protein n=1 Tax=Demequina sp. TaxID=2050685 RepID=UPI003D0AD419